MSKSARPSRVELFAFYYLGFSPDGEYHFPNVHHVARHYNVGPEGVQRWLRELELDPARIIRMHFNLGRAQADFQIDCEGERPDVILERAAEILAELDEAEGGRKPWEDEG